jgi:putative ABC transport system permease protein
LEKNEAMLTLMVRPLRQHWRLNLALLLGLTLAATMVAGLQIYADAIGTQGLHQTIASYTAPPARNILISASEGTRLDESVYSRVKEGLGDVLAERINVRQIKLPVYEPPPEVGESRSPQKFQFVRLWAFQDLAQEVRAVEGRLPVYEEAAPPADSTLPSMLEVAVGVDGIQRTGLTVGEVVTITTSQGPLAVNIVGILEPLEPKADRWWGDPATFGLHVKLVGRSLEILTVSLLVPPQAMQDWLPDHDLSWRLLVDSDRISAGNVQHIQETMTNLQAQLRKQGAELHSRLPEILADVQARQIAMRVTLLLLTAQAFFFVLYVLLTIASVLLDRSSGEMAIVACRGGTRWQITWVFALAGLAWATVAALAGTLMARDILSLWAGVTSSPLPARFPPLSWGLALAVAGLTWLGMVLAAFLRTARASFRPRHWPISSPDQAAWQRLYLDLILLVLGAVLYWQLSRSGSFVMSRLRTTPLADPFLLLASSVLLVAVVLLFLRVLPYLIGLLARILERSRALILPLGLARWAGAPLQPNRLVLLVTLAASLIFFSSTTVSSLRRGQAETARYRSGADLRISARDPTAEDALSSVGDLPGVLAASPVIRTDALGGYARTIDLMAIDPSTFAQVVHYPQDVDDPPLLRWVQALQGQMSTGGMPAIVSRSLLSSDDAVGDLVSFTIGGDELFFEIRAIADEFPTLSESFVVTDLRALGQQIDLGLWYFRSSELWLATEPSRHDALAQDPDLADRILANVQAELHSLESDAMAQGIVGTFQGCSLALGLFSVVGFLFIYHFAARNRGYEFGLLRAMGLAQGQRVGLLVVEGLLFVAIGMLAGAGIGYGLVSLTLPYLSRAMAVSLGGVGMDRLVVDWPAVLRLYGLLVSGYLVAIGLSLLSLVRTWKAGALRLSEE